MSSTTSSSASSTPAAPSSATQDAVAELIASLAPAVAPAVATLLASQQKDQLTALVAGSSETLADLPDAGPLADGDYTMVSQKQADGSFKDVKAPLSAVAAYCIAWLAHAAQAAPVSTASAAKGS